MTPNFKQDMQGQLTNIKNAKSFHFVFEFFNSDLNNVIEN